MLWFVAADAHPPTAPRKLTTKPKFNRVTGFSEFGLLSSATSCTVPGRPRFKARREDSIVLLNPRQYARIVDTPVSPGAPATDATTTSGRILARPDLAKAGLHSLFTSLLRLSIVPADELYSTRNAKQRGFGCWMIGTESRFCRVLPVCTSQMRSPALLGLHATLDSKNGEAADRGNGRRRVPHGDRGLRT